GTPLEPNLFGPGGGSTDGLLWLFNMPAFSKVYGALVGTSQNDNLSSAVGLDINQHIEFIVGGQANAGFPDAWLVKFSAVEVTGSTTVTTRDFRWWWESNETNNDATTGIALEDIPASANLPGFIDMTGWGTVFPTGIPNFGTGWMYPD